MAAGASRTYIWWAFTDTLCTRLYPARAASIRAASSTLTGPRPRLYVKEECLDGAAKICGVCESDNVRRRLAGKEFQAVVTLRLKPLINLIFHHHI